MANDKLVRDAMGRAIKRLKDREIGFGDVNIRPQSYHYALVSRTQNESGGPDSFEGMAWAKAVSAGIIPVEAETVAFASDFFDLVKGAERRIESIVNYLDLYGSEVDSLRKNCAASPELLDGITAWARSNIPGDCIKKIGLSRIVAELTLAVCDRINEFRFNQDLLMSWMPPVAIESATELLRPMRPGLDSDDLRAGLFEKAKEVLALINRQYGVYGINPKEIESRAYFSLISSPLPQYHAFLSSGAESLDWGVEVLKNRIELIVPAYCQPRMDMRNRWGRDANIDSRELKKRITWLNKFAEITP